MSEITLDFCTWLQRDFDLILAEMEQWHAEYVAKPATAEQPKPEPAAVTPVHIPEEPDWAAMHKAMKEHERLMAMQGLMTNASGSLGLNPWKVWQP